MTKQKVQQKDQNAHGLISLIRGIKLGFQNFWRNKVLSLATIIVIAVILFIFNTILAVHFIANQALHKLSDRIDIIVYLRDDVRFDEAQNLTETIKKTEGIKDAKYTSKEQALEIVAKTHPETAEFIKKFNLKNPLPPSVSLVLQKPEDYQKVLDYLDRGEFKSLMKNAVPQGSSGDSAVISSVAKNLTTVNRFVREIIFWIVLVFMVGGILVIVNAVQLTIYTRRNEIYIMRLVGATPAFIRLPFIFEGILYGVMAVAFSFLFLFLLGNTIQIQESSLLNFYTDLQLEKVFVAELVMTCVLGIVSSFGAVEQYLKGKLSINSYGF